MLSLLLSLSLVLEAVAAPLPAACRNVAAFDESMRQAGTPTNHLKSCIEISNGIDAELAAKKAGNKKPASAPQLKLDGTQADALGKAASSMKEGADAIGKQSKAAAASKAKLNDYATAVDKQMVDPMDQEMKKAQSSLTPEQAKAVYSSYRSARIDLNAMRDSARKQAAAADKVSKDLQSQADGLGKSSDSTKKNAEKLKGSESADANQTADNTGGAQQGPAQEQPATPTASPKNALLGLGAVAALGAAAAGGIYLYNQHQKKQDDAAAAAAFALAQAKAAQSQATATTTLTATTTSVSPSGGYLMFAVTGSGQIISNASLAAQPIYDRAKTDIGGLTTDLLNEVSAQFPNYTAFDLAKMENELDGVFAGLIARARAEGNTALVSGLQNTQMQLQNEIQNEISNRGQGSSTGTNSSTGSDVRDSSGTTTSTSTVLSTDTVTRQRL